MAKVNKEKEINLKKQKGLNYKKSGVDVDAGYELVKRIKPFVDKTKRPEVLSGLGSFSALSRIPKNIENPILVTCTDRYKKKKKKKKKEVDDFSTNYRLSCDVCKWSDSLWCWTSVFLDYYVTDKLKVETAARVIEGIANGCEQANCSLVGGETAEHPGSFPKNSFDLAGFSLGVVDENLIIGQDWPKNGDIHIGNESSGFHSNGFYIIRIILKDYELDLKSLLYDEKIGQILLKPTNYMFQ